MSCDVAVSAALFFAAFHPGASAPADRPAFILAVAPAANPLVKEPLFAEIISRAGKLEKEVRGYIAAKPAALPAGFGTRIGELSALDLKGHLELAARGTDGDLKCILKGISQDLPRKLDEVMGAKDAKARDTALDEMAYLLDDNVGVITAPPAPPV